MTRLLQRTVVSLVHHLLTCIEINLDSAVGLAASGSSIVADRIGLAKALHALNLAVAHTQ